MSYQTRRILSTAPAATVGTGMIRNALILISPVLALILMVFLGAVSRMPLIGVMFAGFTAFYAPLLLLSRRSNVAISKDMQVSWKPALRPNHELLKRSLRSLILLALFLTVFALTR